MAPVLSGLPLRFSFRIGRRVGARRMVTRCAPGSGVAAATVLALAAAVGAPVNLAALGLAASGRAAGPTATTDTADPTTVRARRPAELPQRRVGVGDQCRPLPPARDRRAGIAAVGAAVRVAAGRARTGGPAVHATAGAAAHRRPAAGRAAPGPGTARAPRLQGEPARGAAWSAAWHLRQFSINSCFLAVLYHIYGFEEMLDGPVAWG